MSAKPLRSSAIEPLEARIAPALLVNGANLLGGSGPSTGETSVGDHSATLVKVLSGQALVWFDGSSITSISVGPGTRLDISGNVYGDIVGNLKADGTLSDSDNDPTNGEDGGVLLPNDILGVKTHPLSGEKGSVGSIITGGSVNNVDISGSLLGVYAGDGVYRAESLLPLAGVVDSVVFGVDINPVTPGVQSIFSLAKSNAQMKPGASISGVKVAEARELQVFAGNGSPDGSTSSGNGVAGGSVSNVTIETATVFAGSPPDRPSYHLIAGDGQDGKRGGAGGSINTVIESASAGIAKMAGGKGGNGSAGAGGNGGNVSNIDAQSAGTNYQVTAGNGGDGTPGGAGGKLTNNNFANRTPSTGVLLVADFDGDGYDDVLVADPGTGQMVVNVNPGGTGFVPVIQHGSTVTIDAAGVTPIDAIATDMDADNDIDAVVLYKDGTVGIYLNKGGVDGGVFYDPTLNGGAGGYQIRSFDLGYKPVKFSLVSPNFQTFAVAENLEGKGVLHLFAASAFGGDLSVSILNGVRKLSLPVIDLVGKYAGLSDGSIVSFEFSASEENAFAEVMTLPSVLSGGLVDLDLDDTQSHLIALSGVGQAMAIYDVSTDTVPAPIVVPLNTIAGRPLMAKFIHDSSDPAAPDEIVVLNGLAESAIFTRFVPIDDGDPLTPITAYAQAEQFQSGTPLKNFAPAYNPGGVDLAALSGALNSFTIVSALSFETAYPLPFANKEIHLTGGNGGKGLDIGTKLGKGGAGGSIVGLNADARIIELIAGNGGDSTNGAAGAGGSLSNFIGQTAETTTNNFKTAGGAIVTPKLVAEISIDMTAGIGGKPTGAGGKFATGGAGGGLMSFTISLTSGDINFVAGAGGIGKGGAGGRGGDIKHVHTSTQSGSVFVTGGAGGAATGTTGNGGAGGDIFNFTHDLTLDADQEKVENPYFVTITAGAAGASMGAIGGAGGSVIDVALTLDGPDRTYFDSTPEPDLLDAELDSTITIAVTAGDGATGAKGGGVGGSIRNFVSDSVYDQQVQGGVFINYVVLSLTAGNGGSATTAGNGGAGGSIVLSKPISGITYYDPHSSIFDPLSMDYDPTRPALSAIGGNGGAGTVKGGAGGAVTGLVAQNSPFFDGQNITTTHLESAFIAGGKGGAGGTGDGGAGGAVSGALVGVNSRVDVTFADPTIYEFLGGFLSVQGGAGGASASAKGGLGGGVLNSEFGLVRSEYSLGMEVRGGLGGAGNTGGLGGALNGLRINTPQSTSGLSAILVAGDGGAADTATGVGGKGGDANGITQAKDFNSSINLIQAGNGGANTSGGKGGAGGNILNIRTVGFIGRPSDGVNQLGVFDSYLFDDDGDPNTALVVKEIAQGLFAGRGGTGGSAGAAGSISTVTARQIAAVAAAPSAAGLFAPATKVSNVKTALIGFDADLDGIFDTTGADGATPSGTKPEDGFILATALSQVTGTRPAFSFTA